MTEPDPVIIDVSSWTRIAEVREYARDRGVSLDEAIRELVNKGLSHRTP